MSKILQRGEDAQFDQLLGAFGSVAEHCLPSLLRALFAWYERQMAEGVIPQLRKIDMKGKRLVLLPGLILVSIHQPRVLFIVL